MADRLAFIGDLSVLLVDIKPRDTGQHVPNALVILVGKSSYGIVQRITIDLYSVCLDLDFFQGEVVRFHDDMEGTGSNSINDFFLKSEVSTFQITSGGDLEQEVTFTVTLCEGSHLFS